MKTALAQITTIPGKLEENCAKIISYIKLARERGADLVVFPELALPGYAVLDLAYNQTFVAENKVFLNKIIEASENMALIVGFIDSENGRQRPGNRPLLYNSAAVIQDKKLVCVQDKTLLPNYDIFFEDRYFAPARDLKVVELNGLKIGVQICEDLWDADYPTKVTSQLVEKGAEIVINISASPFNAGKSREREGIISSLVNKYKVPFYYVNLIGGFDGYEGETIFDGQSLAYSSKGDLIAKGKAFGEDLFIIDPSVATPISFETESKESELVEALVLGIRDFFSRLGFKRAYIGLSGGIDSSLVAALAAEALGRENIIGVTMPSHITSEETLKDAKLLAANLGIRILVRPIISEFNAWLKDYKERYGREPKRLTVQNKQARIRGAILMECSNEDDQALVISTGNKTELALGYCTLYGDMCGALAAISDLNKSEVYALSEYINNRSGKEVIPRSVITRLPTAELEINQTDRDNLPADYPVLSPLVDEIIGTGTPASELYLRYEKKVVDGAIKLINSSEFKRRQSPPGIRISKKAFGAGRRVPMDNQYSR